MSARAIATFDLAGRIVAWAWVALVVKTTFGVVASYVDYLPPKFTAEFLLGRESYFWGTYAAAFYVHIVTGPVALVLGTLLMSQRWRARWPQWHRRLGRVQGVVVLVGVVPSGLGMARASLGGPMGGVGLGILAVATALCMGLGWRRAWQREFVAHERWMWRTYVLLCSAVVLRVSAALATVADFAPPWFDAANAWTCWLIPLALCESVRVFWPRRFATFRHSRIEHRSQQGRRETGDAMPR